MGLLVDGIWRDKWYDTKSTEGKFIREESIFRDFIGTKKFPAKENRYHLYVSYACPWAHRVIIYRQLKSLENIISMTVVDAIVDKEGWELFEESDPINQKKYLHEVYTICDPKYTGRVTVPVLWDKQERTIVNNESSEIIRMLNSQFDEITGNLSDYYPKHLSKQIDEINDLIYNRINNGVYKVGFATSQKVYENQVKKLFDTLDHIEDLLDNQKYLVGDQITEADWRFFTTLIRFDSIYFGHFKCNIKRIEDYDNISNYLRDLYQIPGIKQTVNIEHIKKHYYCSHTMINPTKIVPLGPRIDYDTPHDRGRFNVVN